MSLLMDALRKAEEAKKQAEQEQQSADTAKQPEEKPVESTLSPPEDESLAIDESPLVDSPPADEPEQNIPGEAVDASGPSDLEKQFNEKFVDQQPKTIPDIKMDFADNSAAEVADTSGDEAESETVETPSDEAAEQEEAAAEEAPVAAPPAATTESSPLSLEPIDSGITQATRKPLDVDTTPDYSAQSQLDDIGPRSGPDLPPLDEVLGKRTEHKVPEPVKRAGPVVVSPTSNYKASAAPQRAAPTSNYKAGVKLNPPAEKTLSERSESEQQAAKTVFAAKRKRRYRFRIRRSTRIWAGQIVAGLIVAVGAYYYFFEINSGGNEFNVPAEYIANQDVYSEQFNEEVEFLDEADALGAGALPGDVVAEVIPELENLENLQVPNSLLDNSSGDTSSPLLEAVNQLQQQAEEAELATTIGDVEDIPQEPSAIADEPVETEIVEAAEQALSAAESSSPAATNLISFTRTTPTVSVDPLLQQAYEAFQQDDLNAARELYQRVLDDSPMQRDALLALASIATREGENAAAMELYSRMLARDPSDAIARAGLSSLRPVGGPEQQESELRRLVELQEDVAPVVYALGNFYAEQGRWNDAQRNYFSALRLAKADALEGVPVNPDYAFNLAVSLEQLNQAAAAETYYREAIAFAATSPASFDLSVARNRLVSLSEGISQ